jgi:hypothetical protein
LSFPGDWEASGRRSGAPASSFLPGTLGVQEAGFVFAGSLLALSPDLAIALSLMKRIRERRLGALRLGVARWDGSAALFQRRITNMRQIPFGARSTADDGGKMTKFIVRCRNVLPYLCGSAIGIGNFEAFLQFADEYNDPNWWDDTLFPLEAGS